MADLEVVTVAGAGPDLDAVKELWAEYWVSFGLAPDFQGFQRELDSLPGLYAPPRGLLLLARVEGAAAGTAALRPFQDLSCEAKRLFVRPQFRGRGIAGRLLELITAGARELGYYTMYGDTLPAMTGALRMYSRLGFEEVPPYSASPTPGAIYLKRTLR